MQPSCSNNGRGRGFNGLLAIQRLLFALLLSATFSFGYTVLTHEAIVDSVWSISTFGTASMRSLLLKRFPGATPEELKQAHAYAYGGCIIQDLGYYPFSSRFFSDLTHYVRSGDFITALIRDSQDLNEYAFALGALEHYAADTEGHRLATNLAVPMLYPKLRSKFGSQVTYWDNPVAHVRTEFGFDVLQVASGRYAPDQYRDFIGFQVSRPLLERAFEETYGVEMKDIFGNLTLALGSYRYSIGSVIPGMTRVAWSLKKTQLQKEIPGVTRKKFLYNLSRSSYEKTWGREYRKPGFGTRFVTFLVEIIPKVGPFRALKIQVPTPEVEKMFMASFNATIVRCQALLAQVDAGHPELENENLDLGEPSLAGQYKGADEAYAKLVGKLSDKQFSGIAPDLRQNILAYYKAPSTDKDEAESVKLLEELDRLKAVGEPIPVAQFP
jgi:hypothetical protein